MHTFSAVACEQDGGVLLVAAMRENVSPSLVLELLKRIGGIIKVQAASPSASKHSSFPCVKHTPQLIHDAMRRYASRRLRCPPRKIREHNGAQDYCGVLSEEAVRKNCVLVYELLDEVIDNGFPQSTSSEALKEYVLNVPIIVKSVRLHCSQCAPPLLRCDHPSSHHMHDRWIGPSEGCLCACMCDMPCCIGT